MPTKEIVIHSVREMDVQRFLESVIGQVRAQGQTNITPDVPWVDGLAIFIGHYPETEKIINERIEGKEHYGFVHFTRTSFQEQKKVMLAGREHVVKLVKVDNPDFYELSKYLQEFKPEPAKPEITNEA